MIVIDQGRVQYYKSHVPLCCDVALESGMPFFDLVQLLLYDPAIIYDRSVGLHCRGLWDCIVGVNKCFMMQCPM